MTVTPSAGDTGMSWWERERGDPRFLAAYFSPEFGLDASLPVYSGGLGILAGDHLKSARDLGVPLVGVGLLYRQGYFRQTLVDGRQHENYPALDTATAPIVLERALDGTPLTVEVELDGDPVLAQVWRTDLPSAPAYLLDTDVQDNAPPLRAVTDRLYGPDREHRIRQEVLLGVGGARALTALGLEPTVYHLNEGHAGFLALERIRALVEEDGLAFEEALEVVRRSTVFTTHTPVAAGNERFDPDLARRYLAGLAERCGVPVGEFLALGAAPRDDAFGLTPLALRAAAHANGVSRLHGAVSRRMWKALWPDLPVDDVPIGHVTNAVHAPTWVAPEFQQLLGDVGVLLDGAPGESGWEHALELDTNTLWAAHVRCKVRLVDAVAARPNVGGDRLDANALTIAFARRFAPYKRASLLFSDLELALELLTSSERPVQILYAGKAYPTDDEGKRLLAEVVRIARSRKARGRVVFLVDYDMDLARLLVQGVDVWLNNPRLPEEASGTSGMKAAMNGVLNFSVLDGWWPEAYSSRIGWAIPEEVSERGDAAEAAELVRVLAEELVPAFYEREDGGAPERWGEMMRSSLATVGAAFNAGRMVAEYVDRFYLPAHASGERDRASRLLGTREHL
jgi:glycogen phosphorylase